MEKNILIVVDVQNGFLKYPQMAYLKDKIEKLLDRKIFDKVVVTKFVNTKNSMFERLLDWNEMQMPEEQKVPDAIEKFADCVIEKKFYSCMSEDFLVELCKLNEGKKPTKVFIVGVDTDCCVLAIATSLFEQNIRPVVLTCFCNSTGGRKFHRAGLLCLKRLIGQKQLCDVEIKTKEDLIKI